MGSNNDKPGKKQAKEIAEETNGEANMIVNKEGRNAHEMLVII